MRRIIRDHGKHFALYVFSGGLATALDYGSFVAMLWAGMWYVTANVWSNVIGFFAAFFLHKYVVFGKYDNHKDHFFRYCILNAVNIVMQTVLLYAFVRWNLMSEELAKLASMIIVVSWNFLAYKFYVYI